MSSPQSPPDANSVLVADGAVFGRASITSSEGRCSDSYPYERDLVSTPFLFFYVLVSFDDCMATPQLLDVFRNYLTESLSSDPMDFLDAVDEYKKREAGQFKLKYLVLIFLLLLFSICSLSLSHSQSSTPLSHP